MRRHLFTISWLFVFLFLQAKAQVPCTQVLKQSQDLYDAGSLLKIPELLLPCLADGFTKEEKIRANKLTTLVHIFSDNTGDSEQYMQELLRGDPEHQLDPAADPKEIFYLYHKFRTKPVFRIRVSGFGNYTFVNSSVAYGVENSSFDSESFTGAALLGAQIGIEREILDIFELTAGIQFSAYRYSTTNQLAVYSKYNLVENQQSLDIPVGLRVFLFRRNPARIYKVYVSAGWSPRLILGSTLSGNREGGQVVSVPNEDQKLLQNAQRDFLNYYAFAGVGVRFRLPNRKNFIFAECAYQRGLNSVNNPQNRYSQPLALRLGYVDNDFSLDMLQFSAGVIFSVYNPKKLRRYIHD